MELIRSAIIGGWITVLFTACGVSSEKEDVTTSTGAAKEVSVKITALKPQNVPIAKTYFGRVNFKQRTTVMAEMPGTAHSVKWKVGQRVHKEQTLLSYPRLHNNLDIENNNYEQAKIARDELKKNYERQRLLLSKGAVNKVSVEQLKSQLEVQQKMMEQLQLGLKKNYSLKAPYSGIITEVHVQPGQQLAPGTPLFSIANRNQLEVVFFVLPKDIGALNPGKLVYIDNGENSLSAEISEIAPMMDPAQRAFRVAATLKDEESEIYAGSTVAITLVREIVENAILVPEEAILDLGGEYFVYIAQGGKAAVKKVALDRRVGLDVIVQAGIEAGDHLITAGMEKLKDNSPISIIH